MSDRDYRAMIGDYVLEALADDERADFERRLEGDAALQGEVRAYHELIAEIGEQTAPRRPPPPGLRGRVLAEARAGRPQASVTPLTPRRGSARAPWLLAAASVLLSVGLGLAYLGSRARVGDLSAEGARLERELGDALGLLAERDSLLETFLGPDVRTAVLAATGGQPSARLFWNTATSTLVVAAFDLPPAPQGRTYQLWGIVTGSDPVSLGTFQTASDGRALVRREVPIGLAFELGAVTEEPAGGSPQPTSAPFLVGSWTGGA